MPWKPNTIVALLICRIGVTICRTHHWAGPCGIDAIAWQIIEEKRKEKGLPSLKQENHEPSYMFTAGDQEHCLGNFDKNKIETI